MLKEQEFAFTDKDFRRIRDLASQHAGICLTESKRDMVYGRLSRRLRKLGIWDFATYYELLLHDDTGLELAEFTNAITTNLTAFFREGHHFEYLCKALIPKLLVDRGTERRLRFWSAGCSTGEEAYSLAMVVRETVPDSWDMKILATDIDSRVLEVAKAGVYEEARIKGLSVERQRRWFYRGKSESKGKIHISPQLQECLTFNRLNLMDDWPMRGLFDVIFCRNVVIYFDKATQKKLVERYSEILRDDGYLFLGHSETLYRVTDRFEHLGQTIYRKIP